MTDTITISKDEYEKLKAEKKLWLWKNGDHYLAYEHEYPCLSEGGDPLTLGNPIGYAILKPSFNRSIDEARKHHEAN